MAAEDQGEGDVLGKVGGRRQRSEPNRHRRHLEQTRLAHSPRASGNRSASARGEETVGEEEGHVQGQLPPGSLLAGIAPTGKDLFAALDAGGALESEQRCAVVGHRAHRRQHRGTRCNRNPRQEQEPAASPHCHEETRNTPREIFLHTEISNTIQIVNTI